MAAALFLAFVFAIWTLWIPQYWPVTVFQIAVFVLAGVSLARWHKSRARLAYPLFPLAFGVAVGVIQLVTGRTVYPFETKTAILRWTTFLAVFIVGLHLFSDRQTRRWFRSAMLWLAFVVAIEATVQTFTSGGKIFWLFPSGYTENVMGPIIYHTHYAAFVEIMLPVALYEAFRRERGALLYAAMAAVLYASVIASASRGGTVLATAEIILVTALMWARGFTSGRVLGLSLLKIAFLFLVFTAIVGWQGVWRRFWQPDPYAIRRELAISSLQMIAARPLAGSGLGTWSTAYPRYAIIDTGAFANQAHSDWLEWTAEGGIPLGIAMLTLFFWCIPAGFRSIWGLGPVFVFLHATADYPFSRPALGAWTILIIAMLAARQPREVAANSN